MGPLFILGFPRSGTTATAKAIAQLGRFGPYGPEGHFLYLFAAGLSQIARGEFNTNSILRTEGMPQQVLSDFRALFNRLYSPRNDPNDVAWTDKTPDLLQLRAVPAIDSLWPDARYIFLYRPPVDAVRSSLATWPERMTGKEIPASTRWVNCQSAWRSVRAGLTGRHVEVFQPQMLAAPRQVAASIQPILDLTDKEVNTLGQIWTDHPQLNRPTGPRGEAYDKVALAPDVAAQVARITHDEAAQWPAIAAHLAQRETH